MDRKALPRKLALLLGRVALLILLALLVFSQLSIREAPPVNPQPTVIPVDPTAIALAKSRLETEKLAAEVTKLQFENQRPVLTWLRNNEAVIAAAIVGIVGIGRWIADRQDARRKHLDERFQAVVEGLGSEHQAARVQAAVVLLNFLGPGYEQYYKQIFDLSVTNLILHAPKDQNTDASQRALIQALARVFKESYVRARERGERPEILDARRVYLAGAPFTRAYLEDVQMPEADLSGAILSRAKLSRANLSQADLRWADLSQAILSQAILSDADLSQADLRWADLRGAILDEVKLQDTRYSDDTQWPEGFKRLAGAINTHA